MPCDAASTNFPVHMAVRLSNKALSHHTSHAAQQAASTKRTPAATTLSSPLTQSPKHRNNAANHSSISISYLIYPQPSKLVTGRTAQAASPKRTSHGFRPCSSCSTCTCSTN